MKFRKMLYERYLVRDRHFYRFGFLGSGILKKMEVLGDRERLMMFEWTHSPIHPAVYRRIARSIELKRPGVWEEGKCRETVMERYGPVGSVGWLDEGAAAEDVIAKLGTPALVREDGAHIWEYPQDEDGWRSTERLVLPFSDGKLARFDSGYHDSGWKSREAIPGGLPWMLEQAGPYSPYDDEKPGARGEKAKVMPEELKEELLRLFLEKAEQPGEDSNDLSLVLMILVEQGVRDPKALGIVREWFEADGGHYAAWTLHRVGQAEDIALFVGKVRETYRVADEGEGVSSDLHNWLAFIPNEDERYPDLLREGLSHSKGPVRETAYYFLRSAPFPQEERLAFVRSGLRDAEQGVRRRITWFYDAHEMSDSDWQLLEEAASRETDEYTRKEMQKTLSKRRAKPAD